METKICTKCKKELPVEDFYWRNKQQGKRRSECKYCHNNYVKMKYQERQNQIEQLKSKLNCAKCGDKRGYVLDLHHLNPEEKDVAISRMISNRTSEQAIQKEIKKCIVLCANCHREFHHLEKTGMTIQKYLTEYLGPQRKG